MHHSMTAESIREVESAEAASEAEDGMVIRSHLIQSSPRARGIDLYFFQHGNAAHGARQNFFDETAIEVGFESWRLLGVIPGHQQP